MASNHRAMWIDIPAQHFNMLHTTDITRAAGRCLKCQDPRIVMKYNQFLANVIKHKQLIQKIEEVTSDTAQENQEDTDNSLEQLDQQWIQAKINTECHCQKLNTGKIPWTPSLMLAIYKVLYWKGLQKQLKGSKISSTVLWKQANQGGEPSQSNISNYQQPVFSRR